MAISPATQAMVQLDWAEVCRSRWLYVSIALNVILAGVFIVVGLHESSILGFTGMDRVMFSIVHMLLLLLPLLALMLSGQVINHGRDDGALEFLFSHPLPRGDYFLAVTAVRYGALLAPFVTLMLALAFVGWAAFGEAMPLAALLREIAVCAALLWTFTGLGLAVSAITRNQTRAQIYLILLWLGGVVLLDFGLIGLMLGWGLNAQGVFLLASLNPVQAARMALLSSADPTLANLGPVGFFLMSRIGPNALFALGFLWPLALGTAAWLYARREFANRDLV